MYEKILSKTKEIESLLNDMGAEGKGLHEKATSIKSKLEDSVVKKIRFIASIRNKAVHESGFNFTSDIEQNFNEAYNYIEGKLNYNKYIPEPEISLAGVKVSAPHKTH